MKRECLKISVRKNSESLSCKNKIAALEKTIEDFKLLLTL